MNKDIKHRKIPNIIVDTAEHFQEYFVKMIKHKERQSNFELLRIISMFMVLLLHADFQALGEPTSTDIVSYPFISAFKVFLEMASIIAVNVFILISGYFGIRPTIKGFSKFVFQWLFFSIGIYIVMILMGCSEFSLNNLAICLLLKPDTPYWFIPSYICLYFFAPVLNSFINTAKKAQFIYVLISFIIFQTIYGFVTNGGEFLMKGYSALSFMGLYLLAGFVRKHIDLSKYSKYFIANSYLLITILLTTMWIVTVYIDQSIIYSRILSYSNPLVIASSLCLLLLFCKTSFSNTIVNKIAASSFAVYLLHCHPFLYSYYLESIRCINASNVIINALFILCVICLWFIIAILLDCMRIFIWNILQSLNYKSSN